jgi:hypothetical protein
MSDAAASFDPDEYLQESNISDIFSGTTNKDGAKFLLTSDIGNPSLQI